MSPNPTQPAPTEAILSGPSPIGQGSPDAVPRWFAAMRGRFAVPAGRAALDGVVGLLILVLCQAAGEGVRQALHLPLPGPVVGLLVLAAVLVARGSRADAAGRGAPAALERASGPLIRHMGLLFVPAGAGLMAEAGLLRDAWLPLAGGLVGSTALGLAVTGLVMARLGRAAAGGEAVSPAARGTGR